MLGINLLASPETVDREFRIYDNIREFLLMSEWN